MINSTYLHEYVSIRRLAFLHLLLEQLEQTAVSLLREVELQKIVLFLGEMRLLQSHDGLGRRALQQCTLGLFQHGTLETDFSSITSVRGTIDAADFLAETAC